MRTGCPCPSEQQAVQAALTEGEGQAFPSIDLGGYTVLAGDDAGLARLRRLLPKVQQGGVPYPLRLAQHGPYHTPLALGVADAARSQLAGLTVFRTRKVPLIDGRGVQWSPWSTDLEALRSYTLGHQVTQPYDLKAGVVVALKEFHPEALVLLGPGNSLGRDLRADFHVPEMAGNQYPGGLQRGAKGVGACFAFPGFGTLGVSYSLHNILRTRVWGATGR